MVSNLLSDMCSKQNALAKTWYPNTSSQQNLNYFYNWIFFVMYEFVYGSAQIQGQSEQKGAWSSKSSSSIHTPLFLRWV